MRKAIRDSRLVVADITGQNPNVLHEVGLAQAFGKPLVIITQDHDSEVPFNLRHIRFHRYSLDNLDHLRQIVLRAISRESSPNETLRAMLVPSSLGQPTKDSWFVIAASPLSWKRSSGVRLGANLKYKEVRSVGSESQEGVCTLGYENLRRTASDYVGIRGILQSFGLLYGFDTLPDNLDPEDYNDCVLESPMNLYCIASPKANHWTGFLLAAFHERLRLVPQLRFCANPDSINLRSPRVMIMRGNQELRPDGWEKKKGEDQYAHDFGIIVRGPNPFNPEHMVAVLAGRGSLGTEAACRAFTEPPHIEEIKNRLPRTTDLENHKDPFWVLVSMERNIGDGREEAKLDSLRIEDVQVFKRRS
jgi:hypothetical protein